MHAWKVAVRIGKPLVVPAVLLALWWAVTHFGFVRPLILPSPWQVLHDAIQLRGTLLHAVGVSLKMIALGLVIGCSFGLFVGLLFGYSRSARDFFEFTLDRLRPVPLFAVIPLFVLWFGIGQTPQIAIVALGVFLIITLQTIEAIRNVPHIYVRAALVCGASRLQIYRTVVLPAIVPHLVAGFRFAAFAAWGLDVAAEYAGSQEGLGYLIIVRTQYLDTAGVFVVIATFGVLAIALDMVVRRIANHFSRWSPRAARGGVVSEMLGHSG
jgi:ABC-type nitrate/sulfonate/bicarbonate transport system permease component